MKPIAYKPDKMELVNFTSEDEKNYAGEYIDMRIDRNTVPAGKFVYECRHDDNGDWVTPVTIEDRVCVNFAGTFITDEPIEFSNTESHYIPLKVDTEDTEMEITECPFCGSYNTDVKYYSEEHNREDHKCLDCHKEYLVWYDEDGETPKEITDRHNKKID